MATKAAAAKQVSGNPQGAAPEPIIIKQDAKTLVGKLAEIMLEVDSVDKNGKNTFDNYTYMRAADLMRAVRTAMARRSVLLIADPVELHEHQYQSAQNKPMNFIRVKFKYTFINGDDPADRLELHGYGDASDRSDKAIYKANTGAIKYVIRNTFLVPDEDADPETETNERANVQPQRQERPAQQQARPAAVAPAPNGNNKAPEPQEKKIVGIVAELKQHKDYLGAKVGNDVIWTNFDAEVDTLRSALGQEITARIRVKMSSSQKAFWEIVGIDSVRTPDPIAKAAAPATAAPEPPATPAPPPQAATPPGEPETKSRLEQEFDSAPGDLGITDQDTEPFALSSPDPTMGAPGGGGGGWRDQ